jgi:hypothetical protein
MAALRHPNVVMFMGLCLEPPCIVTEFCARGSLYDVLKKARGAPAFAQQLDWSRRISMALDAAKVLTARKEKTWRKKPAKTGKNRQKKPARQKNMES